MTSRIVEISSHPAKLFLRQNQLVIQRGMGDDVLENSVPLEDLGVLILSHQQCSITLPALAGIASSGGVVIACGPNYHPAGVLLPISHHTETVLRIQSQIEASVPLTKQLWKQVVVAKVCAQAANLEPGSKPHTKLLEIATKVRSGDSANHEAQAAKIYWKAWGKCSPGFSRDKDAGGVNGLLNFGYAIARAAMARALVASGFCTAIGIHHKHRSNAFCLADDLMEPLRPLVDAKVARLVKQGWDEVCTDTKRQLYQLLLDPVMLDGQRMPMLDSTARTAASLAACLKRKQTELLLPKREGA